MGHSKTAAKGRWLRSRELSPRQREWLGWGMLVLVLVPAWRFLMWFPEYQLSDISVSDPRLPELVNDYRTTLVQLFGGSGLLLGLLFAWRRIAAAEDTAKAAVRQVHVSEQGQVTERFTRAIDQLGNEKNLTVRLGGIYSLERIARDSQPDHWTVVEVLTAFVRQNAARDELNEEDWPPGEEPTPPRRPDVQAALTVLGRRQWRDTEEHRLDLMSTDLRQMDLSHAHFEKAQFANALMKRVGLWHTHLEEAWLDSADLPFAHLRSTHLEGASLDAANLRMALFNGAYVSPQTTFFDAHMEGARFREVLGLTQEHLARANGDERTRLPDHLVRPEHWKKKASGADEAEETAS